LDKDRNQQEKNENEGTITKINDRMKSLDALLNSASYSKQKCNLKKEVENFLVLLDPACKGFFKMCEAAGFPVRSMGFHSPERPSSLKSALIFPTKESIDLNANVLGQ
jgi:hypothetical protein